MNIGAGIPNLEQLLPEKVDPNVKAKPAECPEMRELKTNIAFAEGYAVGEQSVD